MKTSRLQHFEITEIRERLSALKIYCGKEMRKLARNLPDTARVDGDDEHEKPKRKLESHFFPKKNKHHARLTLSKQKRIEGESVVTQKKKHEETAATSQKTRPQERRERERESKSCGHCRKTGAHPPGRNCSAYGQQCFKCGKYNHYSSCCRMGAQTQEGYNDTKRGQTRWWSKRKCDE